tara:strand:- start:16 stop:432 length:417 start_codon:yes stop_codon:yes gene_type:complete
MTEMTAERFVIPRDEKEHLEYVAKLKRAMKCAVALQDPFVLKPEEISGLIENIKWAIKNDKIPKDGAIAKSLRACGIETTSVNYRRKGDVPKPEGLEGFIECFEDAMYSEYWNGNEYVGFGKRMLDALRAIGREPRSR